MPRHKHADLIHAWAEGAEIQIKNEDRWADISTHVWLENREYRIKPSTIKIGDREVPEPLRVEPEIGTTVWLAAITSLETASNWYWDDACVDRRMLARGLLHSTEEAARAHAEALIALSAPQHEDKSDD